MITEIEFDVQYSKIGFMAIQIQTTFKGKMPRNLMFIYIYVNIEGLFFVVKEAAN